MIFDSLALGFEKEVETYVGAVGQEEVVLELKERETYSEKDVSVGIRLKKKAGHSAVSSSRQQSAHDDNVYT